MSGLIIDNFAGGGGASTGIEQALGRPVDYAINHDAEALAMHAANHPETVHLQEDVFKVSPRKLCAGRPVGLAWFSPDCRHFSKAKGGKPVSKKIRGLAWVAVRWAKEARPDVIVLENVEEFVTWGPLIETEEPTLGPFPTYAEWLRVRGFDHKKRGRKNRPPRGRERYLAERDAHNAERREQRRMVPDPARRGETFRRFVGNLRGLGYAVEWRELVAADYGAPTTRKRFFLIARCDGKPIVWPEPTHARNPGSGDLFDAGRQRWRSAAECIDWSLPCPSIFGRRRPLAENTLRRIAAGLRRFVIEAKRPFVVPTDWGSVAPVLTECANASSPRAWSAQEPLRTACAQVKGGHFALVSAFLAKHYGDNGQRPGSGLDEPTGAVTAVDHHSLVAATLVTTGYSEREGQAPRALDPRMPLGTAVGTGKHALASAFLVKYYGNERDGCDLRDPMDTITSRDRLGLVTIQGTDYRIVDIGLRMLTPRELARAMGFPESYVLTGTKTSQVARIGNSVCPPLAAAIVRANCPELRRAEVAA